MKVSIEDKVGSPIYNFQVQLQKQYDESIKNKTPVNAPNNQIFNNQAPTINANDPTLPSLPAPIMY